MQAERQKAAEEAIWIPGKPPAAGGVSRRSGRRGSTGLSQAPAGRPPSPWQCSGPSARFYQGVYWPAGDWRVRWHEGNRETVRRALSPPRRQLSWRWRSFQATPSRLSSMSMA
ncbi:hypothetical protein Nepgr_016233 [Nepenthes gracilis]|uniref:Uncharacterized protein n=1 Tax=Nepenthes gracilis TaxID=150966 RepID=A0AAD3SNT8_NEPGR|nr:hypothetical protein Nepgr_016233 [Nepenthes gracilis]